MSYIRFPGSPCLPLYIRATAWRLNKKNTRSNKIQSVALNWATQQCLENWAEGKAECLNTRLPDDVPSVLL